MYKQTPNMIRKEIYICKKFWSSPCRIQQISKLIFMSSSQSIAVSFEVRTVRSYLLISITYFYFVWYKHSWTLSKRDIPNDSIWEIISDLGLSFHYDYLAYYLWI